MADDSITACGEVRLETRAQEPHAPPVEPPPVPVVVPDDQPNEPQEREEPEPEEEEPEPLPPAAAPVDDEETRALLNLRGRRERRSDGF